MNFVTWEVILFLKRSRNLYILLVSYIVFVKVIKMIKCVECGKEITKQYQNQDWCEECHKKFHEECKKLNKDKEDCSDCGCNKDCYNN